MVFFIVFVDGDDFNEFIIDIVWGILDGYIVLLRVIVNKNYYLVIDVFVSISRVMNDIVDFFYREFVNEIK